MNHIYLSHILYLSIPLMLLFNPLSSSLKANELISTLSKKEQELLFNNHNCQYIYLGKSLSNMYNVISRIKNLDNKKKSLLSDLLSHIENNFLLAGYDEILNVLKYAETVIHNNHHKLRHKERKQLYNDFTLLIDKILNGKLNIMNSSLSSV